jgi:acyl dehydratase
MTVKFVDVEVGTDLPGQSFDVERSDLVRYAGASGDFNAIHWSEETATGVGLPDVIAHGMLTMALGIRVATDWVGDPGAVVDYGVRFTRPVVVPRSSVVTIDVSGKVISKDETAGTVVVSLTAAVAGKTIMARARSTVRLAR